MTTVSPFPFLPVLPLANYYIYISTACFCIHISHHSHLPSFLPPSNSFTHSFNSFQSFHIFIFLLCCLHIKGKIRQIKTDYYSHYSCIPPQTFNFTLPYCFLHKDCASFLSVSSYPSSKLAHIAHLSDIPTNYLIPSSFLSYFLGKTNVLWLVPIYPLSLSCYFLQSSSSSCYLDYSILLCSKNLSSRPLTHSAEISLLFILLPPWGSISGWQGNSNASNQVQPQRASETEI